MSYTKAKKEKNKFSKEIKDAKAELAELKGRKDRLMQTFADVGGRLTDARAALKVGDGSKKEVDTLKSENKKLKDQLDQVREDIETQQKVVTLYEQKHSKARQAFTDAGQRYYQKKREPITSQLTESLQAVNDAIEQLNKLSTQARNEGVQLHTYGLNGNSEAVISKARFNGPVTRQFIRSQALLNTINN